MDQDPTLTISFNLNSFCKDAMSKYSHTVGVGGGGASGLQHMNGEGGCNSVQSRGVIFKISNYCPQAPTNQNRRLPSLVRCQLDWCIPTEYQLYSLDLDETKEAKSSSCPPPGKISTVHVRDGFCHIVCCPKM